jgi:hypothetical protein
MGSKTYPNGDEVRTVERWTPPGLFERFSTDALNKALDRLRAGPRFPPASRQKVEVRSAGQSAVFEASIKRGPDTSVLCLTSGANCCGCSENEANRRLPAGER